MKNWQTKSWKSQRTHLIDGQVCSQCGKKSDLQIHHTYLDNKLRNLMEHRIVRDLIKKKMDSGEISPMGKEFRELTCSKCGHHQKITHCTHRNVTCKKCHTFQALTSTNTTIRREYNYNLGRTGTKIFMKNYRAEIDRMLEDKKAPSAFNYEKLDQDTVILCKVCHYALENGYDMCPQCKKKYKKMNYLTCWDCLSDEEKHAIEHSR